MAFGIRNFGDWKGQHGRGQRLIRPTKMGGVTTAEVKMRFVTALRRGNRVSKSGMAPG